MANSVRSILITAQFSPLKAGAPRVYDALAKASHGKMAIFTAKRDHLNGNREIVGWHEHDQKACYPVFRVDTLTPASGRKPAFFERLKRGVRLVRALKRAISVHEADVVILSSPHILGWLVPALRLFFNGRILLYLHGEEVSTLKGPVLGKQINQARRVDGVITVSGFTKEVAERLGFSPARISVIPNGVDKAFLEQATDMQDWRQRLGAEKDAKIVVSVGRLIRRKGFTDLLDAWQDLRPPKLNAILVIVGTGPERERLEAHSVMASNSVHLIGAVSDADLADLYKQSTLFVLANRTLEDGDTEGFGMVFLEAGLFGIPSIGRRAGGVPDAIKEDETGVLVDPVNPHELSDALLNLLKDEKKRKRMGDAARAHALQQDWDSRVAAISRFCQTLKSSSKD